MAPAVEAVASGHRRGQARAAAALAGRLDSADVAVALRWGTLAVAAVAVVVPAASEPGRSARGFAALVVLACYAAARTRWPIRSADVGAHASRAVAAEALLCSALVLLTGGWRSPLLATVAGALLIAGLLAGARGLAAAVLLASAGVVLGTLHLFGHLPAAPAAVALQRIPELVGLGAIGAYAHRLLAVEDEAVQRLGWMSELHALLLDLNRLAAEHPGLLTIEGAVQAIATRLSELAPPALAAVLLQRSGPSGPGHTWDLADADAGTGGVVLGARLPALLQMAVAERRVVTSLAVGPGEGLRSGAVVGLYAPVVGRVGVLGALVLEREEAVPFSDAEAAALGRLAHSAALALDSARSFERLRNLGALEERERIGRELHDRVGQALAAVAFRVDRLGAALDAEPPEAVQRELALVGAEIREVNGEIRETLAELRGGPSVETPLDAVLEEFLTRVETRSPLAVAYLDDVEGRLPLLVEREIWRIACEAIRNVERHAGAQHLSVSLRDEGSHRVLEVRDDGRGIEGAAAWRPDAYGLVGMRERAELIGATLAVEMPPGGGTAVRLEVARR